MKVFGAILALAAAAVATPAFSAQPVHCPTCVTDSDFRQRAMLEEAVTNAGGTFWVYNLPTGTVQKWYIPRSNGGGGGGGTPRSVLNSAAAAATPRGQQQPVEAHVQAEVQKGRAVYIKGANSLRPLYNVPVEMLNVPAAAARSVTDVLSDANLKAQLESKLGDTDVVASIIGPDLLSAIVDLAQMATNALGLKEGTYVNFRLIMEDGTYIDFHLSVQKTTADAQEDTARTASGQLVPESIQQLNGTWTTNGGADNLDRLGNYFESIGATMIDEGSGGYTSAITCAGGRCIRQKIK
ncbi:hypothetical protein ACIGEO_18625 [Stenotrophomonas bentonitica]|uniref:hypothetical protein n=1 Tax=Stenotrophomonas bentonitica TaxID=1450134 RepID=UPI0037D7688F